MNKLGDTPSCDTVPIVKPMYSFGNLILYLITPSARVILNQISKIVARYYDTNGITNDIIIYYIFLGKLT